MANYGVHKISDSITPIVPSEKDERDQSVNTSSHLGQGRRRVDSRFRCGRRFITPADVGSALDLDRESAAKRLAGGPRTAGFVESVVASTSESLSMPPTPGPGPTMRCRCRSSVVALLFHGLDGGDALGAHGPGVPHDRGQDDEPGAPLQGHTPGPRLSRRSYKRRRVAPGAEERMAAQARPRIADRARTVIDILDDRTQRRHPPRSRDRGPYLDEHDPATLVTYADRLGNRTVFKRLGYLVETLGHDDRKRRRAWLGCLRVYSLDLNGPCGGRGTMRWRRRAMLMPDPNTRRDRKAEAEQLQAEWTLDIGVIEKDYLLGWLLAGIVKHPYLGRTWAFKGGTCLRKRDYETFRFSEDLDFTVVDGGPDQPQDLVRVFSEIKDWLDQESGVQITIDDSVFRRRRNLRGNPTTQGRIADPGPKPQPTAPKAKIDITAEEAIVDRLTLRADRPLLQRLVLLRLSSARRVIWIDSNCSGRSSERSSSAAGCGPDRRRPHPPLPTPIRGLARAVGAALTRKCARRGESRCRCSRQSVPLSVPRRDRGRVGVDARPSAAQTPPTISSASGSRWTTSLRRGPRWLFDDTDLPQATQANLYPTVRSGRGPSPRGGGARTSSSGARGGPAPEGRHRASPSAAAAGGDHGVWSPTRSSLHPGPET